MARRASETFRLPLVRVFILDNGLLLALFETQVPANGVLYFLHDTQIEGRWGTQTHKQNVVGVLILSVGGVFRHQDNLLYVCFFI